MIVHLLTPNSYNTLTRIVLKSFKIILCLFLFSILPYMTISMSERINQLDTLNILVLFLFLLLPLLLNKSMKILSSIISLTLYFFMLCSLFSYRDFLSKGAFASIMESDLKESAGYIYQFGILPFLFSFFISMMYLIFIFKTKLVKIKFGATITFICILGSLYILFSISYSASSDRYRNIYKIYPMFYLSRVYSRNFISPITHWLGYYEEIKLLDRPQSMSFPNNINKGYKSDYNKIYLIIGESASKRHFSFEGYRYPTTPTLEKLKYDKNFHWVKNSISPTPITRESIKRMLTFATATDDMPYYNHINLINAAKEKGFSTLWLSSQGTSGIHNSTTYKLGRSAEYFEFGVKDDLDLSLLLDNKFNDSKKQFFILHLDGSHAAYNNYLNEDYQTFVKLGDKYAEYDATIRKTDRLLNSLIGSIPENSLLIYLSDHGEVVGWGHGLSRMSQDQFEVPFLVYDSSGNISKNINFLSLLSQNGIFNTERTMEFILYALGYEVLLESELNSHFIRSSNGELLDYRKLKESF